MTGTLRRREVRREVRAAELAALQAQRRSRCKPCGCARRRLSGASATATPAQMAAPTIRATAQPCAPKTSREAANPSRNATPTVRMRAMRTLRRTFTSIGRSTAGSRATLQGSCRAHHRECHPGPGPCPVPKRRLLRQCRRLRHRRRPARGGDRMDRHFGRSSMFYAILSICLERRSTSWPRSRPTSTAS